MTILRSPKDSTLQALCLDLRGSAACAAHALPRFSSAFGYWRNDRLERGVGAVAKARRGVA